MKIKIPKYIIKNILDVIDAACNWVVFIYVAIFAYIAITESRIVDLKTTFDIMALIAFAGMILIPNQQHKQD